MSRWSCVASVMIVCGAWSVAGVRGDESKRVRVLPEGIEWGPGSPKLPAGAQIAVLQGDPSVPGEMYVFRAKLPDGFAVAPHIHPEDENVTVIQGTFMIGFGETRDPEALRACPAGSYVVLPKKDPHFNLIKGETILQFHGIGPYDIIYVDPKDDPSRKAGK